MLISPAKKKTDKKKGKEGVFSPSVERF